MKKIFFVLSLFVVLAIGISMPIKSSANEFYEMKNYLDITNLRLNPEYGSMVFETIYPITLKKDTKYTLVIDENSFGRHADYHDLVNVVITHIGSSNKITKTFSYNNTKRVYYVEFEPVTSDINFQELPADLGNNINNPSNTYNIMLYEGGISDFDHFEVYVDPLIGYHKGFVPIDHDNQLTLTEIRNLIKAETPSGQNVAVTLESSNYLNTKNNKVGTYHMVLVAKMGNNYRRFTLEIRVIDIVAPQINAPEQIVVGIENLKDIEELKKEFSVSDNADKTLTYNDLVIEEETYSNATTVGEYMIKVSLTDESGNKSTKQVPVVVMDNKAPVIKGPENIYLYSSSTPLTEADILSMFTAYDEEEKEYKSVYVTSNTYLGKTTPGLYEVVIKAKDTSNNERSFRLYVYVIDDTGPIFKKDDLVLTLSQAQQMTNQELINWFYSQTQLAGESVSNVTILFNEYEDNKTLGGTYSVYLQYERDNRIEQAKITIDVEQQNKLKPLNIALYTLITSTVGIGLIVTIKRRKV